MTKEEIKTFTEMYDKFTEDCKRVLKVILGTNCTDTSIYDTYTFRCIGDEVAMYGDPLDIVKYGETFWGSFPLEFLSMSDKELRKEVKQYKQQIKDFIEK